MAPKKVQGKGGKKGGAPTEGTRRSTRFQSNPVLEPLRDDIDRVLRRPRQQTTTATRGRGGKPTGRGGRSKGAVRPRSHPPPAAETGTADEQAGDVVESTSNTETQSPSREQSHGPDPPALAAVASTQTPASNTKNANEVVHGAAAITTGHDAQTGDPEQSLQQSPPVAPMGASAQPTAVTSDEVTADPASIHRMIVDGEGGARKDSGKPTKDGKRGSPDPDDEQASSTKKVKNDKRAPQDLYTLEQDIGTGQPVSCVEFAQRFREWKQKAITASSTARYNNPITWKTMLEDVDVYRAIASVSEAVLPRGQHIFSVMDPNTLQRATTPGAVVQTIARTRHELLVPWTEGGHTSLFVLRQDPATLAVDAPRFRILHYGTSNSFLHRSYHTSNHVRRRILNAGWTGHDAAPDDTLINGRDSVDLVARQRENWTCGIHTIFNAWAYALGLALSGNIRYYTRSIAEGVDVVRLAVRGHMDSRTILAFFNCYDFIAAGEQVTLDRQFDSTQPFPYTNDLASYVARVRLAEDWRIPSDIPEVFQHFDIAADTIADAHGGELPNPTVRTAADFLELLRGVLGIYVNEPNQTPGIGGPIASEQPPLDFQTNAGHGDPEEQQDSERPSEERETATRTDEAFQDTTRTSEQNTTRQAENSSGVSKHQIAAPDLPSITRNGSEQDIDLIDELFGDGAQGEFGRPASSHLMPNHLSETGTVNDRGASVSISSHDYEQIRDERTQDNLYGEDRSEALAGSRNSTLPKLSLSYQRDGEESDDDFSSSLYNGQEDEEDADGEQDEGGDGESAAHTRPTNTAAIYHPEDDMGQRQLQSYDVDNTEERAQASRRSMADLLSGLVDDPELAAEVESDLEEAMREVAKHG